MNNKYKYCAYVIILLACFAIGRYSAPTKVVNETKTDSTDRKTVDTDTDRSRHRESTTVEVQTPDGTKTITTKVIDDTSTERKSKTIDDSITHTQTRAETVYKKSSITISALAGLELSSLSHPIFGAAASKEILGPIGVGVWGLNNGTFGASISLTF